MDSSVLTRNTGSPGRMTRGRNNARGTARNDVYGVTNLYWRARRMISSIVAWSSPSRWIFSSRASTRALAHSRGSCAWARASRGRLAFADISIAAPCRAPRAINVTFSLDAWYRPTQEASDPE